MEDSEYINWEDKQQQQQNNLQQSLSATASPQDQAQPQHYWPDGAANDSGNSSHQPNFADNPTESTYAFPTSENQRPHDYSQQMYQMPYSAGGQAAQSHSPPLMSSTNYMLPVQRSMSNDQYPPQNMEVDPMIMAQSYQQPYQSMLDPNLQRQHMSQHSAQQGPTNQSQRPSMPNPYQYANNALYRNAYPQAQYPTYGMNSYGARAPEQQSQHSLINPSVMNGFDLSSSTQQNGASANHNPHYGYQPLSNGYNPYNIVPSGLQDIHTAQYYQNRVNNMSLPQNKVQRLQTVPSTSKVVKIAKPVAPAAAEPARPSDPLQALKYDVSLCLDDYNTSRDLKGCAAALLAIMSTCDQAAIIDQTASISTEKDVSITKKNDLDPKVKQLELLTAISSQIKGKMIEEVSLNKSIRAKLRTWFVRAHKDNSLMVLKATVAVLDKLTFLTEVHLAEVKFGKALLIVSRKCQDQAVKDSLEKWVPIAQKSLLVEDELNKIASKAPPLEDEPKVKKQKMNTSVSAVSKPKIVTEVKKIAKQPTATKKAEPVAKLNTAFFKKEAPSIVSKLNAPKPGVLNVLNSIKVKKRTENDKPPSSEASASTEASKAVGVPTAKPSSTTPAFSALKFVETLKRGASPLVSSETQPEPKKRKQKKRVSWKPDADLEQVKIFETSEPEDGDGDVAHTPHEYGNARDLDRKEGAILHGGVMHDREEDFLDWEIPTGLDFSHKDLSQGLSSRGPKRAGNLIPKSVEGDLQTVRESQVLLTIYTTERDIPWSPSESLLSGSDALREFGKPIPIPLPEELRTNAKVRQILGRLADLPVPEAPAMMPVPQPSSMATSIKGPTAPAPGGPDIAAILASIAAAQSTASASGVASTQQTQSLPIGHQGTPNLPLASTAAPPLPLADVDPKLAEFLKSLAAQNGGVLPPPPPSIPLSNFNAMSDVRPWVTINTGGKYREPCRFIGLGKCEKGDSCPYIHPKD